ncbi:gonadotropin-releasing hormone receptor [Drosophila sulfurigaster albostrigata]|uniref:gonadotropin-releasing hormone receptor n=1 Tax=Drosophila sulfurigaster albostrigata TaxID=89887 RepID=UPI002D21C37D|nr:gonadotropin-releasing hormone receptor [Drosophila sulfurigaster albostrigata]
MDAFEDSSNGLQNLASNDSTLELLENNSFNDTDSRWSTVANFTRLFASAARKAAPKIANFTFDMLDVGLSLATEATDAVTAPTPSGSVPITTRATETAFAIMTNTQLNGSTTLGQHITGMHDTSPLAEQVPEHVMDHAPQLSRSGLLKVYVLAVMALFSLLGNLLTIWNIYKTRISRRNSRHTWSAIYSLMFHLSIADVLVTGFCLIGEAAWCYTVQWLANELTCKLVKLFQMFSLYLSTYVLVLIGVDRWIAVKYPMKSLNMAKRCHRLLGGTYILSLVLSLPQFFIFHVARGPFVEEFYQCVTHGFYTADWQEQMYATFTLVFTFLLPLCILFGTYMSTFRTISSSEKMFQGSKLANYSTTKQLPTQTNRQRLIHKAKMKSLRISVVIIIAFLICWTPYYVMMIIFMFWNPDKRLGDELQDAIFFFGMSNSLVNPLIYGAFHLCPGKGNKSGTGGGNNNAYSLNRGDSQRTPSMLTAVTQVDAAGGSARQMRTFRQQSYYRSSSNGAGGAPFKEQVGLLQVGNTVTPQLMRKSSSVRSPHPNHSAAIVARHSGACLREQQQLLLQTPPPSTLVLNYDSQRGGVGVGVANGLKLMTGGGGGGLGGMGLNDEHVSSV